LCLKYYKTCLEHNPNTRSELNVSTPMHPGRHFIVLQNVAMSLALIFYYLSKTGFSIVVSIRVGYPNHLL